MTTRRLSIFAAAVVASGLVAAADTPRQDKTTTLTGCVRTGSASTVYILRGAADPPPDAPDASAPAFPEDFLIVAVPNSTNLADLVNHRMEMTGVVTDPSGPPGPPAGANAAERALKRISVRSVKEVAPNCAK